MRTRKAVLAGAPFLCAMRIPADAWTYTISCRSESRTDNRLVNLIPLCKGCHKVVESILNDAVLTGIPPGVLLIAFGSMLRERQVATFINSARSLEMERAFEPSVEWRDPATLNPVHQQRQDAFARQIAKVASSIATFGFDQPIVVDGLGVIIKGHARREASLALGLKLVPVVARTDLCRPKVKAARIADNKTAESPWNDELLRLELQQLEEQDFALEVTGFNDEELECLLREPEATSAGETDEDASSGDAGDRVTVPATVWLLGAHRFAVRRCYAARRRGESHGRRAR